MVFLGGLHQRFLDVALNTEAEGMGSWRYPLSFAFGGASTGLVAALRVHLPVSCSAWPNLAEMVAGRIGSGQERTGGTRELKPWAGLCSMALIPAGVPRALSNGKPMAPFDGRSATASPPVRPGRGKLGQEFRRRGDFEHRRRNIVLARRDRRRGRRKAADHVALDAALPRMAATAWRSTKPAMRRRQNSRWRDGGHPSPRPFLSRPVHHAQRRHCLSNICRSVL